MIKTDRIISASPEKHNGKPVTVQVIILADVEFRFPRMSRNITRPYSFTRHLQLGTDGVYRGWNLESGALAQIVEYAVPVGDFKEAVRND